MGKVFSLSDLKKADGTRYNEVAVHGGRIGIGTLSTLHILDWMERRKDPNGKVDASMFLIVRSLVDEDKNRVPDEQVQEYMDSFKQKDDKDNGALIDEILKLNDLLKKPDAEEELKNGSGEATIDASPSV